MSQSLAGSLIYIVRLGKFCSSIAQENGIIFVQIVVNNAQANTDDINVEFSTSITTPK